MSGGIHPDDYAAEGAYLVYPLGTADQDPEELITFDGVEAVPRPLRDQDEANWRRARVMIDFFGLNRDGRVGDRAWWLLHAVWPNVGGAERGDEVALRNLSRIRSERAPFSSCSRCFLAVCEHDRERAAAMVPVFEQIVDAMA